MSERAAILGAGMTGLAAGSAAGLPVFEAAAGPGGICRSYYVVPGSDRPLADPPGDDDAYRFEIGGGHWLFGAAPEVLALLGGLGPLDRHTRRASVFFPDSRRYVPYPLQNHLRCLEPAVAQAALEEMARPPAPAATMAAWLGETFGATLDRLFFTPFHERYTAGLHREIAPQDAYKSPVDLALVRQGARVDTPAVGYNVSFVYPRGGLGLLARRMAERCAVAYRRRVVRIEFAERVIVFADGSRWGYDRLLSTLPLNRMLAIAGLSTAARPDPFSSVLVVNLGATRGPACPDDHWLYIPRSASGCHRVGFYSNVDPAFLPARARTSGERVALYVERSFPGGARPPAAALDGYCRAVVEELQDWGFIGRAEVVHPSWVEVAYTWSWPGSGWRAEALRRLAQHGIEQVGRYARWRFQGIARSIHDGLAAGRRWRARSAP